jgi:hypothetical protein
LGGQEEGGEEGRRRVRERETLRNGHHDTMETIVQRVC